MKFGRFEPWAEYHEDGEYYEFHCLNGFGATVARGQHDELFELDVLRRNRRYPNFWGIYDMPITNDGMNMEYDDVVKALEDISRLADDYDLLHKSFVDHDGNVVFVD